MKWSVPKTVSVWGGKSKLEMQPVQRRRETTESLRSYKCVIGVWYGVEQGGGSLSFPSLKIGPWRSAGLGSLTEQGGSGASEQRACLCTVSQLLALLCQRGQPLARPSVGPIAELA